MPSGDETVAEQLATVLRGYRKAMSAALMGEDYGPIQPAATWLLLAMDREPGTVGVLATRLGLTKQAVSRLADRPVILGYCDRRRDEGNRRQVLLPTSEGGGRAASRPALAAMPGLALPGGPPGPASPGVDDEADGCPPPAWARSPGPESD